MIDWNLFKRAAAPYTPTKPTFTPKSTAVDKPATPVAGGVGGLYDTNAQIPKAKIEEPAPKAKMVFGNEDQPIITGGVESASGVGNAIHEMEKEKPKVKMPETMASSSEETGGPSLLRQYGLPLGILGAGALGGYGLYNMFKKKKKRRYEEDAE